MSKKEQRITVENKMEDRLDDHCELFGGAFCETIECHGGRFYPKVKKGTFIKGKDTWDVLTEGDPSFGAYHCQDCHDVKFNQDVDWKKQPLITACIQGHGKWYEKKIEVAKSDMKKDVSKKTIEKRVEEREQSKKRSWEVNVHCNALERETRVNVLDNCFEKACHDKKMSDRPMLAFSNNNETHCESCHGVSERIATNVCIDYHEDMLRYMKK